MSHSQPQGGKGQPLYVKILVGVAIAVVALVALVTIVEKLGGTKADDSATENGAVQEQQSTKETQEAEPFKGEIIDLSTDEMTLVTASYPVSDAFTNDGIIRNLQEGCIEALKQIQTQTENWWEYDTLQCSGISDWSENHVQVGSANFTGAQLAEVSLDTISPEELWAMGDSRISPELQ